ncbi:MAG: sulfatase-like hydrolase/transferase [Candidatus Heimdallarchaeota archaeon]|nr:sulfatase-like hydrolase/transferase [Candidatus Heimdallarchaeota archaeon]
MGRRKRKQKKHPRVFIVGLDCFDPYLLFSKWIDELPNLKSLLTNGCWGKLQSSIPPITAPAWACMLSGVDPGTLGVYGFKHKKLGTYDGFYIANSEMIKYPRIWNLLSARGFKVGFVGVPQTYPPKIVNGYMVTSFLTPDNNTQFTYPPTLKDEIEQWVGEYPFDCSDFRGTDKERILEKIYEMTRKRTTVTLKLLEKFDWNLFMTVYMGPDRIQHAFWRYMDKHHHAHTPNHKFKNVIRDYYRFIDQEIGKIIEATQDQETIYFVVSDHGAKRNNGTIAINEWLIREGYLTLKKPPQKEGSSLHTKNIDWEKTKARGVGGYYGRIYLNVKGREPNGIIDPTEYEEFIAELTKKLENLTDNHGNPMNNKIFTPSEIFEEVNGDYPDLMVFFDDLAMRSAGTIGYSSIYLTNTDIGFDDANHDWNGVFIISGWDQGEKGELEGVNIIDICPTILEIFRTKIPRHIQGKVIK